MDKKKLLVTGASGFLGWNLCSIASVRYSVTGVSYKHIIKIPGIQIHKCDITDYRQLKDLFSIEKPEAVIHAAASSNPNYCQLHQDETFKINVTASTNIAALCADLQIPCVFTSTDLVFDGKSPPYKESDPVGPVNIYGEQKATAEIQMYSRYQDVTICRMPLMYGDAPPTANSFILPWIKELKSGNCLSLFTDEFRTPVSAHDASEGLLLALEKVKGILHLGGTEKLSRYQMGELLMRHLPGIAGKIVPCKQSDVPMAAPRPTDVTMDSSKAFSLGYKPGKMSDELKALECMRA